MKALFFLVHFHFHNKNNLLLGAKVVSVVVDGKMKCYETGNENCMHYCAIHNITNVAHSNNNKQQQQGTQEKLYHWSLRSISV